MVKKSVINASELHRSTGKALKRVFSSDEHLVVERGGIPVAVLISYKEYEKLMQEHTLRLHKQLMRSLSQEAERQGLTEEQLMDELRQTRRAAYEDTY